MTSLAHDRLQVVARAPDDDLAAPLFAELAVEYDTRYGDLFGGAAEELTRYPAEEFLPPDGELILLLEDGVAGRRRRVPPAPRPRHRRGRSGCGPRPPTAAAGWPAGCSPSSSSGPPTAATPACTSPPVPRQPEAKALYLAAGWTPLFDLAHPRPTDLDALRDPARRPAPLRLREAPGHPDDHARTSEPETAAPPAGTPYDQLTVVPARHPGRWIATAVVAVLLAMVLNSLITNPRWEWDVVGAYLTEESIVRGVWTTIELTLITAALGFALGTVLALMRLSRSPLLQAVSWGYTWVFRSVPLILQLLLWYNLAYLYQQPGRSASRSGRPSPASRRCR